VKRFISGWLPGLAVGAGVGSLGAAIAPWQAWTLVVGGLVWALAAGWGAAAWPGPTIEPPRLVWGNDRPDPRSLTAIEAPEAAAAVLPPAPPPLVNKRVFP